MMKHAELRRRKVMKDKVERRSKSPKTKKILGNLKVNTSTWRWRIDADIFWMLKVCAVPLCSVNEYAWMNKMWTNVQSNNKQNINKLMISSCFSYMNSKYGKLVKRKK